MSQQELEKPIMDDYIMKAIGDCLGGMKRVDYEFNDWQIKAYWAGTVLRIDMKSDKWNQNNVYPLTG